MKGYYLITTDSWFYAPDGKKYRAVWGSVEIFEDSVLGVKTNRNSSNWYAHVGSEEKGMIVAGCQIHYSVKCKERPFTGKIKETIYNSENHSEIIRDCEIYIAE